MAGRDRDKDLVKNGDSWPYVDSLPLKRHLKTKIPNYTSICLHATVV